MEDGATLAVSYRSKSDKHQLRGCLSSGPQAPCCLERLSSGRIDPEHPRQLEAGASARTLDCGSQDTQVIELQADGGADWFRDQLDADLVPIRHGSAASLRRRLGAETQQAAREYSGRAWEVFDGAWVIREGHAPDCAGVALHSRQGLSAARLPELHPPPHTAAGLEPPSL